MSALHQESIIHINPDDPNIKDSNDTKQLRAQTIGTWGIGCSDSDIEGFDNSKRQRLQTITTEGVYELFDPVDEWYFGRKKST